MSTCDLCGAESKEFLDLGKQPMANKYPYPEDFAREEFFDVKVNFCPSCKNIQLDTKVSRETLFVDYYYLSSVNEALVKHYTEFAQTLQDAKFVLDIGSNDGISLKPLKEMGVKYLGLEPSVNVSKIANDAGYETLCAFFNAESSRDIEKRHGKPDVITGLSMFSHLQDPHTFLEDVKGLLSEEGKFIVEVEYNVEILKNIAFERFYLDRIFYFSVTSFNALFKKHGMVLVDAEVTGIHGGSLRVTAQKQGVQSKRVRQLLRKEKQELTQKAVREFANKAHGYVTILRDGLKLVKSSGERIAAYGCPARTATITNFGDIGPDLIEFVVDDSPLKQGRYSPGKHIPVVTKEYLEEHRPNIIVVFAFEYFEEIKKKLSGDYVYLFPIPPRIVT